MAKPSVVSKTLTGLHGHLTAALLAEMQDVRGSAGFENCGTDFRYCCCIRQGGVEAPALWGRVAKQVLWTAEEKWRAEGWGLSFGGQHDNEYTLRGMMRANKYWLFSDSREKLICMVNDLISLWWTSTCKNENMRSSRVGVRDRAWDLPFCEVFDVLGYRFHRDGKGCQGAARSVCARP